MYNIAKVAKGEILVYFNHIFDALCKVWLVKSVPRLPPSLFGCGRVNAVPSKTC